MIDGDRLPTIEAERVVLRWLTERDAEGLFAIFSDKEVVRYWSSPAFRNREEAGRLIEEVHRFFREGSLYQWGIALREDDRVIGTCTLAQLDVANRRAEIGFALGREHWGKGIMTEALIALLDHGFGPMNLHRVEADVDPRNVPSIRTMERLGFQREGYLRERWLVHDEKQDSVFYGLLEREWLARTPL